MTADNITVMRLADHVPGPAQGDWTYKQYAALDDGKRYEVVNGVLYMTPAPNIAHQEAVLSFGHYLLTYAQFSGLGKVFVAPCDVELAPNVVVQPDVLVVLNVHKERITKTHIVGAPDIVVEVSSPGTATYDRRHKYDVYLRAGVQEYWLVDPVAQVVEVLSLEDGIYQSLGVFEDQNLVISKVVPAISELSVAKFFATAE
ncbi:MAG: Uma2 family endonuclease [Ktedonobacteraceae bacterium]